MRRFLKIKTLKSVQVAKGPNLFKVLCKNWLSLTHQKEFLNGYLGSKKNYWKF